MIDRQLNTLLEVMLGCSPAAVACITSSADTVGARCDIMRRLVYEEPIGEAWTNQFVALLNTISGEIGPLRNRFAHDYWGFSKGTLTRLDRSAATKRRQSHKPIELVYDIEHVTDPHVVDNLTKQIGQTAFLLHCAWRDLEDWKRDKRLLSPPLLSRANDLPDLPDALRQRWQEP